MTIELTWPDKDPDDVLDYVLDHAAILEDGETIDSSDWTASSNGITMDDDDVSGTKTILWLSGGTSGRTYKLTNRIVTSGGRTKDQSVTLKVASQ